MDPVAETRLQQRLEALEGRLTPPGDPARAADR
ncbi:MAG: hypothetical protein KatS3mg131_2310 [Candidatus Tectimicrobiota bacterium]|nr:MAG: hypothetical protein KatS3mg131_2310 [Candidatus Tectomicrobia bacterium]